MKQFVFVCQEKIGASADPVVRCGGNYIEVYARLLVVVITIFKSKFKLVNITHCCEHYTLFCDFSSANKQYFCSIPLEPPYTRRDEEVISCVLKPSISRYLVIQ